MSFKKIVDISKLNKQEPEKGCVLLSEPFMEDTFFKQSAVLLCEHNNEGSFGLNLNNNFGGVINDLVPDIKEENFYVSLGGPVDANKLFYIHSLGDMIEDSTMIKQGLWSGGNFNQITSLINDKIIQKNQLRFFLGYSGWDRNQLSGELKIYSWIVTSINNKDVIIPKKNLWRKLLKQMGGKYKLISNFPETPSLN